MTTVSSYLRDLAVKCRSWSRSTYDLNIATKLCEMADDLECKATKYKDTSFLKEEKRQRLFEGIRRPFENQKPGT
jgi:hypothetical protein